MGRLRAFLLTTVHRQLFLFLGFVNSSCCLCWKLVVAVVVVVVVVVAIIECTPMYSSLCSATKAIKRQLRTTLQIMFKIRSYLNLFEVPEHHKSWELAQSVVPPVPLTFQKKEEEESKEEE